jgi:maltooligosyltrehalose trehalohydrolase
MLRKPKQIMENGVLFNLWAPSATSVELLEVGQSPRALSCDDDGWYQGFSPTVFRQPLPVQDQRRARCS